MRRRIPLEALLAAPRRTGFSLSPDGRFVAYSAPTTKGPLNLWLHTLGEDAAPRQLTDEGGAGVLGAFWSLDARHLCYPKDRDGDENTHLITIDLATNERRDLTPFEDVRAELIGRSPAHPTELLVALNKDDAALHDAYRLDIETGQLSLIAKNPGNVCAPAPATPGGGWISSPGFTIGAATIARDGGRVDVVVDTGDDAPIDAWRVVRSWELEDTRAGKVIGFSADGRRLMLVDSLGGDTARVLWLDLATGDEELVYGDPGYDVTTVVRDPGGLPLAVMVDRERAHWHALDPRAETMVDEANNCPEAHMVGLATNADLTRWLVTWSSPQRGVWWEVVPADPSAPRESLGHMHALADYRLPTRSAVNYRSRDGLTIHGYLTTPVDGDTPGPLVLVPHGGPWHRDYWDFDPVAAWLGDRGYFVLQPNFRGSTGYGKTFLNAGNREWGAKMHDDLVDAVEWAVAEGIADPARVAIFGGSYGGYAALLGATFTPTLFACIVDMFGWGDLVAALKSLPAYWGPRRQQWYERVGNPDTEPEFLWSRSPLSRVSEVCRPILIAQGANDVRVRPEASEQVVAALEHNRIDHEYLLFSDEGHGFMKPANVLTFYARAEAFLARHLAPTH